MPVQPSWLASTLKVLASAASIFLYMYPVQPSMRADASVSEDEEGTGATGESSDVLQCKYSSYSVNQTTSSHSRRGLDYIPWRFHQCCNMIRPRRKNTWHILIDRLLRLHHLPCKTRLGPLFDFLFVFLSFSKVSGFRSSGHEGPDYARSRK